MHGPRSASLRCDLMLRYFRAMGSPYPLDREGRIIASAGVVGQSQSVKNEGGGRAWVRGTSYNEQTYGFDLS